MKVDVAIVGGGPAGSTLGALLKKYDSSLSVLILERELFPRDHVGESQLPPVSLVLEEMGCWDEVEKADFPIKVGVTYCWGKTQDLWDFDFFDPKQCQDMKRPGTFTGVRRTLAFQVDRAKYDDILLKHAGSLGCDVRQQSRVTKVTMDGDRVSGLSVEGIGEVTADTYIDASGHAGILRRAANVEIDCPTNLRNVAVWEYWRNAKWAEQIGVGGTRVQVMSVGYGWIWFIPLGPDRTSVGLVVPAEYVKQSCSTLPELYLKAIAEQPLIASLMQEAVSEGETSTTKDWSFLAKRQCGENWFLVGESSGFADPILAAGLTITQLAAREAAYTILEERRGGDPAWLRATYERRQIKRINSHIRFADYWYTANAQFTDLIEHTAEIAKEAGLSLTPEEAWRWLSQGGFIDDDLTAGLGGLSLPHLREINEFLNEAAPDFAVASNNVFRLRIDGAEREVRARYEAGRVLPMECLIREGKVWPLAGRYGVWLDWLKDPISVNDLRFELQCLAERENPRQQAAGMYLIVVALEALITDGWIEASYDPSQPLLGNIQFKSFQWHRSA